MNKIIWITVNCTTNREAWNIGYELLQQRLIGCFDLLARGRTAYWWPPKKGKIEMGKGTMLLLVTLPKHIKSIEKEIKRLHSDEVPFYGTQEIKNVNSEYVEWLKGEVR